MRRLTLQGARWHQHGISIRCINPASLLFAPTRRPFSSTFRPYDEDKKQGDVVRYYEQSTLGSTDRIEIDLDAEDLAEEKALKARIAELEQQLAEIKQEPFAPNSPLMQRFSEEERVKVLEALRKYDTEHKDEEVQLEEEEAKLDTKYDDIMGQKFKELKDQQEYLWDPTKFPDEPSPAPKKAFEVELTVPDTQQASIARFNQTLNALRSNPSFPQRQDAWRSYRRCKEALPFFLDMIPEEGLQMLWRSQVPHSHEESSRLLHWETLGDDILSSGRDLGATQWLEYLGLLRQNGKSEKALSLWEGRAQDIRQCSPEDIEKYLKLGIQIHVALNKPERARDIAMAYFAADTSRDPRVLIPVITSWAQKSTQKAKEEAWTLYLQVKTMLGPDINMQDYDSISTGLLKAGQVELAMAVFKDMMLTGQQSSSESMCLFKANLGLYDHLHASSISASDVNKVSLAALTILPRKFQNKFFYASWIKKLIGMNEVDAAASVVELMYERGVKPDSKHLNGIIGAWLRAGSPSARDKAEQLGWAMIQKRIDWICQNKSSEPSIHDMERHINIPKHMQRPVPAANIETFSILLLHYTRRDREDMVNHLTECLNKAQIKPNTFFMNHLLYRELRKQNISGVWTRYNEMTSTIKPDLETFACLYDCGKIQYDRTRFNFDAKFPPARSLYKEMIQWFNNTTAHEQKKTKQAFSKELYDQIVRCFCLSLDPQGALVALRSMKQIFGFSPDLDTTRILIFLLVRLAPAQPGISKPRRRRIASTPRAKENFEQISQLLAAVKDRKVAVMSRQGLELDELGEEEKKTFQVELLCDLLRLVMGRIKGNAEKTEKSIQAAAEEMGVSEVDLGVLSDLELP
ncbi:predicted protein [Uncinocarpus reesii 1704]|uniref:Pentatricopeptide repeat protein n=1 Tax=Uncinocarpus reesii (strain UAMH 1704) TaxID=336963 RepID=C4JIE7_UNCRE|nr:uncharacterized protein UREG_01484 [Uncinocarpus reesii 1704]EEP76635.1 predicted protein [Uncinocarpus reesii 1704]